MKSLILLACAFLSTTALAEDEKSFACGMLKSITYIQNPNLNPVESTGIAIDVKRSSNGSIAHYRRIGAGYDALLTKALANPNIEVCAETTKSRGAEIHSVSFKVLTPPQK